MVTNEVSRVQTGFLFYLFIYFYAQQQNYHNLVQHSTVQIYAADCACHEKRDPCVYVTGHGRTFDVQEAVEVGQCDTTVDGVSAVRQLVVRVQSVKVILAVLKLTQGEKHKQNQKDS